MSVMEQEKAGGATPAGTSDERSSALAVRKMFGEVAPRYDLLNHILSMNIDRTWWWRAARSFKHILGRDHVAVLDLCCGTGDMTLALRKRARTAKNRIIGADFTHEMLRRAAPKVTGQDIGLVEADALKMPFPTASFDLVISAFGFRNLANYRSGLAEIARVLKPGGEVGILDFSEPRGILGKLYRFYFKHALPTVGGMVSGKKDAYTYLPQSVEKFPEPEQMLERMREAGFSDVSWTAYSFGIAGLYRGKKA